MTVKNIKRSYFNDKIQEIMNKIRGLWELMNWIKWRKLPTIKAINYDGQLCLTLDSLWNALHKSFNSAQNRQVDLNILDKIKRKPPQKWSPFSKSKFLLAINKCKDSLAPGPDKLSWCHLKSIIQNDDCLANIINITDSCIILGYWPNYFKISTTIIILKPNKSSYDQPKAFRPIVLLNMLGKLIEKVVAERLQFLVVNNEFIHLGQLGSLKFKSTSDAGIALTHIQSG